MPPAGEIGQLTGSIATAATLYSIFADNWLVWNSESKRGDVFTKKLGLHHSWTSTSGTWEHFPTNEECHNMEGHFCQMWRTTGFMMNIAAVLEFATLIAYLVIIIGGRQKREVGWKILVVLLAVIGLIQCFAMSTVVCMVIQVGDVFANSNRHIFMITMINSKFQAGD